jgi:hypothetical protein
MLTGDVPLPASWAQIRPPANVRVGQIPVWMDEAELGFTDGDQPDLFLVHHSELFRTRAPDEGYRPMLDARFRDRALPTFNSCVPDTERCLC